MTLEEAIKHAEEKAEELRNEAEHYEIAGVNVYGCEECAKEHDQLAEWLKELQTYRNRECETCKYSENGKCAGTEKCHECMWQNQYEQEPSYYPPCIDCHKKMDEIRRAYDKLKEQELCDEDAVSREFMYKLGAKCIATRNENGVLVAIASIESLPSINPQPNHNKWIPVTEKRPELGVKVLIQRAKFGEFDIGFYDDYHERICWQNGTKHTEMVPHWWYFGGRLSDEDPIAWMPLPKPYKPQERE